MNDRHLKCILGQTYHLYAKKEAFEPYLMKKKCTQKYSHITYGYTHVLTKIPFYPIQAKELQNIVYRRKDLTLICICDIILEKKIHIESYINI